MKPEDIEKMKEGKEKKKAIEDFVKELPKTENRENSNNPIFG